MALRGVVGAMLLVFALCGNARAGGSSTGNYYSFDPFSCADFVSAYSAEAAARNANRGGTTAFLVIKYYVAGWLTAYNWLTPDTYNIVPGGLDGAALWLNNYCTKNPLKTLERGLHELVAEAYPSRQQNAPGP